LLYLTIALIEQRRFFCVWSPEGSRRGGVWAEFGALKEAGRKRTREKDEIGPHSPKRSEF